MKPSRKLALQAAYELQQRHEAKRLIVDDSFPEQAAFVRDQSRFLTALCTRRAGKSNGLGFKFFNAARKYPGSMSPYIALTRESAKNIMWPVLLEINEKYKIGAKPTESDLTFTLPNKATIKLFGADMKNFMNRLKGIKAPFVGIDEAQAFRAHITDLVDEVLTPTIADYDDGQVAVTGTPGPVPKGYFYDISQGAYGFKVHGWDVYDNPYMPNAREFVNDLMQKKNWTETHPTYLREWCRKWIADTDALVYRMSQANLTDQLPQEKEWFYVLGVDLGFSPDPSAFVLCAFSEFDRHMYILESHTENEMDVSDVAARIKSYLSIYPNCKVIADLGAQGKMIGEEIRRRYAIPIVAAEKHGKAGFIELMNADLNTGLIKLIKSATTGLQDEWANLIWDAEKDEHVEDKRYENHRADAALYAWRWCYNYAFRARPVECAPQSENKVDEFWERESERIKNPDTDERDLYGD
jgi:hypothetical protein